jgi:nitroimidazol reductase NimA-like FMN-containing flavoprotein (pyridoxamine 5'-phosphate oxidase superfamily)
MLQRASRQSLDRAECLELLAGKTIGRVVFTNAAMPAVAPVNYLLDGEEVIFRTANGSPLGVATRRAVVAFEVDDIDSGTRTGWSILAVGNAYEIADPGRLAELAARRPMSRRPGHTISIPLQMLSGRRLSFTDGLS